MVCIVSTVRFVIVVQIENDADPDFTFTAVYISYWTMVEIHLAIVCACLMTLKPLVSKFFPSLIDPLLREGGANIANNHGGAPLTIGSRPMRKFRHPNDLVTTSVTEEVNMRDLEASQSGSARTDPSKEATDSSRSTHDVGSETELGRKASAYSMA